MTERLHLLSRIGKGNGNPLQCSCLENPRDGGAWWAAVYGVAQSRTRLHRLGSSSSRFGEGWEEKTFSDLFFPEEKLSVYNQGPYATTGCVGTRTTGGHADS